MSDDTRVLTVRLPADLADEVARRSDELDRSVSWYIRNAIEHSVARTNAIAADPERPLDELWKTCDESGTIGRTYELLLSFNLPTVDDQHDNVAYDIREHLIKTLSCLGVRDVVTRLIALSALQADYRTTSVTHRLGVPRVNEEAWEQAAAEGR